MDAKYIDSIPVRMAEEHSFCVWAKEERNGRITKPPRNPFKPAEYARPNHPEDFAPLDIAVRALDYPGIEGLGVSIEDGLIAIDLDHCITGYGDLSRLAKEIIVGLPEGYAEISPSGDGLHLFYKLTGNIDDYFEIARKHGKEYYTNRRNAQTISPYNPAIGAVEVYISGHTTKYVTVTGNRWKGIPEMWTSTDDLTDLPAETLFKCLLDMYMQKPAAEAEAQTQEEEEASPRPAFPSPCLSDADIVRLIVGERGYVMGDKLYNCWSGDWRIGGGDGFNGDESAIDLSLCTKLAFYSTDAAQIERVFKSTGHYATKDRLHLEKWERSDYVRATIGKAIASCTGHYNPQYRSGASSSNSSGAAAVEAPAAATTEAPEAAPSSTIAETPAATTTEGSGATAPALSFLSVFDQFVSEIQTSKYEPVKTGVSWFDKLVNGGLIRGRLVILQAAPGVGKTALIQQVLETMVEKNENCSAIYANFEMSPSELLARSIARVNFSMQRRHVTPSEILNVQGIDSDCIHGVFKSINWYREHVAPRMEYMRLDFIKQSGDVAQSTLEALENRLNSAKASGKPIPFVCVDYLQIIHGGPHEDKATTISRVAGGLRDLAQNFGTVVFLIVANNRTANQSGGVNQEAARDSSGIEYSADTQIALVHTYLKYGKPYEQGGKKKLNRSAKREQLTQDQLKEVMLYVNKGRNGEETNRQFLHFDGGAMTFKESTLPEDIAEALADERDSSAYGMDEKKPNRHASVKFKKA